MKSFIEFIQEKLKINSQSNINSKQDLELLQKEFGNNYNIRQKKSGGFEIVAKGIDLDNPKNGDRVYSIYQDKLRYKVYGKYSPNSGMRNSQWKQSQIIKSGLSNIHEIIRTLRNYIDNH